jgi:hypothetical protein
MNESSMFRLYSFQMHRLTVTLSGFMFTKLTLLFQAVAHHYDSKALLMKWDRHHITVWSGMVGMADASHEHAVARCVQGPDGSDLGRKSFIAAGCSTRRLEEHEGRSNILAVAFRNKDGSVRAVTRSLARLWQCHNRLP